MSRRDDERRRRYEERFGSIPPETHEVTDVSDLGALGEAQLSDLSAEDIARRVAAARKRGRSWRQIAAFLGISARQAKKAYGTAEERRHPGMILGSAEVEHHVSTHQ